MNASVRALFPGARSSVYLDVAAKGLVPTTVRDFVVEYVGTQVAGATVKEDARMAVEGTRRRIAALLGASADEIAMTKNVSEGINLVAASLPWRNGDNVVLCPSLEHPNNVYPWYNLRRRHGVEIRSVPSHDGVLPVEAMAEAMDEGTRVVTFSTVSTLPGFLADTGVLVDAAHAVGALTVVDAAQSVGAVETDVRTLGFDVVSMTAQKCLLSFFGCGFLYVRRDLADELVPVHLARYGVELDGPETAHSDQPLRYRPGALRFDLGNYNYLGVMAVARSLDLIEEIGVATVEVHGRTLARRLARGLLEEGVPVAAGEPGPHLAHVVTAGRFGGRGTDGQLEGLHDVLLERGIIHSLRNGMLRFSVGLYNDETDIERTLEAVRLWRRRGPRTTGSDTRP